MNTIKPLPSYLAERYAGWHQSGYSDNKARHRHLAEEGQHPQAMIISCCDSRVHPTEIFEADIGEFFVHRNIANLVPPCRSNSEHHGTSATIEYAVTALKVAHIVVLGHSSCGGVKGCHDKCSGAAPEFEEEASFIGKWIEILRPGYERVKDEADPELRLRALERQAVIVSLENLMTYPFVQDAVKAEQLSLHGLWTNIGDGRVEQYVGTPDFVPL